MAKGIPKSGVNKGWFKKGRTRPYKGEHRLDMKGTKNPNWKGDAAGYSNKHHWVQRWFGKATQCERCEKGKETGHTVHWSSKSGKCLRKRSDWMQLCVSCHKKYDLKRIKKNLCI